MHRRGRRGRAHITRRHSSDGRACWSGTRYTRTHARAGAARAGASGGALSLKHTADGQCLGRLACFAAHQSQNGGTVAFVARRGQGSVCRRGHGHPCGHQTPRPLGSTNGGVMKFPRRFRWAWWAWSWELGSLGAWVLGWGGVALDMVGWHAGWTVGGRGWTLDRQSTADGGQGRTGPGRPGQGRAGPGPTRRGGQGQGTTGKARASYD
jgi:hypothetical protein